MQFKNTFYININMKLSYIFSERKDQLIKQEEIDIKGIVKTTTLQDWALYVFFVGFALFSLSILIYIFRFSKKAYILGIVYMLLTMLLYVCFVFIIQRFG